MKETANFKLNTWEKGDRIMMEDFNRDNQTLDGELARQRDELVALTAAMALKGNCRMETFTYVGNGKTGAENPTQVNFSKKPVLFFIQGESALLAGNGAASATLMASSPTSANSDTIHTISVTWNGSQASFYSSSYPSYQMNVKNCVYHVFAFYLADQA